MDLFGIWIEILIDHLFFTGRTTPRYEWPPRHYYSTSTSRPDTHRSHYEHHYTSREERPSYHDRGSDGKHMPGPFIWYNETFHWTDNRSRGYDPDLDGTTLPPEPTYDEEEWDGTDLKNRQTFDDRHPILGRKK